MPCRCKSGKVYKTDKVIKMGNHTANPPKLPQIVHNRTHQWIVLCKHIIVETSAGILAIVIWETFLHEQSKMDEVHQVAIMVMNNSIM